MPVLLNVLILLIVLVAVCAIAYWFLSQVALPYPLHILVVAVVAIVALILLWYLLGALVPGVWPRVR